VTTPQLAFMAVAVLGGVLYHLAQKAVPAGANPFAVLFHAYVAAALLCLAAVAATAPRELRETLTRPSGIALVIGVAVLLIEAGFLFAYRSGWPVGRAALVQSLLMSVILLPVGYFLYQEEVSAARLAGAALCLVGMALLVGKR
jgi:drug/metabolite transporter (DMT)-like permease